MSIGPNRKARPTPKTVNPKDAVFAYTSVCCSAVAEKPACSVAKGAKLGTYLGAKPEGEATLGSWRCSACRKPCKCTRTSPKPDLKVFGAHEGEEVSNG